MIGQEYVLKRIYHDFSENNPPAVSLILGGSGSGKYMLAQTISKVLCRQIIQIGERAPKVAAVKSLIEQAYKVVSPSLFVILDIDKMSNAAKNSLLKVIEDPPNNAVFVLTASNISFVPDTIRSRTRIYYITPYTEQSLCTYIDESLVEKRHIKLIDGIRRTMLDICDTPGEINDFIEQFNNNSFTEFTSFVNKVVDNITKVSISNVFKITNSIKLNAKDKGYDIKFFWKMFSHICYDRAMKLYNSDKELALNYLSSVSITSEALMSLDNVSLSRTMLFDGWIIEVRKKWN